MEITIHDREKSQPWTFHKKKKIGLIMSKKDHALNTILTVGGGGGGGVRRG